MFVCSVLLGVQSLPRVFCMSCLRVSFAAQARPPDDGPEVSRCGAQRVKDLSSLHRPDHRPAY